MHSDTPHPPSQVAPRADARAVVDASEQVRRRLRLTINDRFLIGVILGSGLGAAANRLLAVGGSSIGYEEIPGMPTPLVTGHTGRLVLGRIAGIPVAMLQGRVHYYEGHSNTAIEFGTRLLHALGAQTMVLTNAAGGIRAGFQPGNLMVISGHLQPVSAHFGNPHSAYGPYCLPESPERDDFGLPETYDLLWNKNLRDQIRHVGSSLQIHEGVYAMMTGPNYETPAEIRMLRCLGADAVGMSTVPEALAAAELGMRVLGVSCITNIAAGLSAATLSHLEVTETAARIESRFTDWLWNVIRIIGQKSDPIRQEKAASNPFRKRT